MKNDLRLLIGEGKTEKAIQQLTILAQSDRDLHDQALALSARYQAYLREKNGGTNNYSNLDLELNRINTATLGLIKQLPTGVHYSKKKPVDLWKVIGRLAWIIGILVFMTMLYSKYLDTKDAMDLTVFVHGPNGKMDIVLENEGRLIIDFGKDRRTPLIGENGRVNCEEIPNSLRKRTFTLGIEGTKFYELAYPDKEYRFSSEPIYLALKRKSTIEGIIQGPQLEPIEGALITVNRDTDLTTTSNRHGLFIITVPQSKAKLNYELLIEKVGYTVTLYHYNMGSSKPADIRMEKAEVVDKFQK